MIRALPEQVRAWIGKPVVILENMLAAEVGLWQNFCAAIQDGNPLYWEALPKILDNGPIAPPALLPAWITDHEWRPAMPAQRLHPLALHFMLKEALDLPFGIAGDVENVYGRPVRAGDRLRAEQILNEISDEYQTRLGPGRRWVIELIFHHQNGDFASRQTLRFTSYRKG